MEILYEDNHLIAINKQVSDLVQGDKSGDESLDQIVKKYIKQKYNKPGDVFLGVVHRLDRPVSGVVVFARTSKALTRMNQLFQQHQVKKSYWAVVKERPAELEAVLTHYLVKNEQTNKSSAHVSARKNTKEAILHYQLLGSTNNYHLLEVDLMTGRHHQIRAQLSKIGCPIRGDLKYGFPRSNPDGGIHLHARSIRFIHPVKGEEVFIVANPPRDQLWDEFMTQAGS